ncbi:hypothetical protein [Nonomuraea sp. NPDC050643]|uniref:hypothetical protein n=1 Tax=Nonomuraea sp. NPDC050643 TaxID=3155660 RepID=UPI0033C523BB
MSAGSTLQAWNVSDLDDLRTLMGRLRDAYEGDPEAGHGMEDALLRRVLCLIVEGHPQAADFAAVVLEASEWDVTRWYA